MIRESNGEELLRRPEINYCNLTHLDWFSPPVTDNKIAEQIEIQIKYQGYIARQQDDILRKIRNENLLIPQNINFRVISGLSNEAIDKLNDHKPSSIGQASRISGITSASISILLIWLKKQGFIHQNNLFE